MKIKKLLSLFLALALVFSCAGGWSVRAEEAEDPALAPTLSDAAQTAAAEAAPLETIHTEELPFLRYIDEGQFFEAGHVARLSEEESLDTYVFLNRDGTKSVYYMGRDVKFVDTDGTVRDKDTTLIPADGGYTMRQNDVGILLPEDPATGVLVVSGSHGLRLVPQGGSGTGVLSDNAVLYEDFYGEGMSLKYTPMLDGVKEDIILDSYSGVHSFAFALQAAGLSLYERDGTWCLATSETAEAVFTLGEILVYDAVGKPALGTLAVQEIRAGVYTLTVSAPVEFLTDPTTVYPVTIDPTITSKDTMTAANIEDATVFSGYPNNNFGNYVFNTIGYQDATYGTGRVAVRLKGLLNDATYQGLSAADISSVLFYMKDGGSNYAYVNIHALTGNSTWTESTIKNSNLGTVSDTVYANGRMGGSAWTAFNLTELAKAWKTGAQNGQCGFLMVIADSTKKIGALSCEYGSGDYWPYVKVTYEDDSVLNRAVVDIDKGAIFTLTVENPNNLPLTWISDDQSVATVNGTATNCVVTGVEIGTTTVRVSSADGSINAKCKVYVTVADGVYYIKNASSGLCLQGAAGSTTIGAQRTDQETRLDQLWKIAHVGGGYYVIRPMMDFGAALTVNNSTYVAVGDAAVENDQVAIGSCWTITLTSSGYAFKRYGSNAQTVTPVVSGQPGSAVYAGTWDSSLGCHWELESIKGIFLRDTTTLEAVTSNSSRHIVLGCSMTLTDLGICYEIYGGSPLPTWSSDDLTIAKVNTYGGAVHGIGCDTTFIEITAEIDDIPYSQSYKLYVMPIPEGTYYLRNKQTGYYADFDYTSAAAGSTIYQYTSHNESTQRWEFSYLSDGYYSIQSACPGASYYLGVENDSPNIQAGIVLRDGTLTDGMKWKVYITDSGAYMLAAKSCSVNYYTLNVNATMPINNVELLQGTYLSDDNYQDEWLLYRTNDNAGSLEDVHVVSLEVMYDQAYQNRYPNSVERIVNQMTILQDKYLDEFGILINWTTPMLFNSYADYCTTDPNLRCAHCLDEACTDYSELHHNNITNILSRLPEPSCENNLRSAYIGHVTCAVFADETDPHAENPYYGLAYRTWGLFGVMCFDSETYEKMTLIHEFGHMFEIEDHYGGKQESTADMRNKTGNMDYSEDCIYGENRFQNDVLMNFTICDGCKSTIEKNAARYDQN